MSKKKTSYKMKILDPLNKTLFEPVSFELIKKKPEGGIATSEIMPELFVKEMVVLTTRLKERLTIQIKEIVHLIYDRSDLSIAPFLKKHNLIFDDFKYGDRLIETRNKVIVIRED